MAAQNSNYQRRNQKSAAWGLGAGLVGALIIVGMLLLPLIFKHPNLDEYGCPESGTLFKTVILLDVSDPLSEKQKANLDVFLGCLMGGIESGTASANKSCQQDAAIHKYDRLVAYQLPGIDVDHPELLQSACSPGDVNNRSFSDKLSEGRRYARANWERFKLDIYGSFERSKLFRGANSSPLLEGIQYVASREFSPPNVARRLAGAKKPEGRLIIISDFMQNTDELSHYKNLGALPDVIKQYPFSLSAAEIEMRYLQRANISVYQTQAHQTWWAELFNYKGYGVPSAEIW